jgi:hypothetical protein
MRTKTISWVIIAGLLHAPATYAQSQFESTFEVGVGYTRPATESVDMVSLLLQADEFFFESGIGVRSNLQGRDDTVFSWLVRGGGRVYQLGNVKGHVGGEFSLHTNSAFDEGGGLSTLIGLGFLVGASHALADHLNVAVHVYPFAFEFGGEDTTTKILVGEIGLHMLF